MSDPTAKTWNVYRESHFAGNYDRKDDFLTIFREEKENFNKETHDWIEVHGPDQETNAHFIASMLNSKDVWPKKDI